MAVEDFSTYTKVDPGTKITVTSTQVAWTTLGHNQVAYVYKDKGVDYFDGYFECLLTIKMVNAQPGAEINHLTLANDLGGHVPLDVAGKSLLAVTTRKVVTSPAWRLSIYEVDSGDAYRSSEHGLTVGTVYYLKIVRNESVGVYGTLYCYVYSDAARTDLLNTLTLTLHTSKKDFRYVYACQTHNNPVFGASQWHAGYTENLEIILAGESAVVTQAVTNIANTTAIGNGNITNLGLPDPTAHGVCWNTTGSPTTADSKTDEGAVAATGPFITSMTNLAPGITYYVKAYVTNPAGTFYGAEVSFEAGENVSLDAISIEADVIYARYMRGKDEELEAAPAGSLELRLKNTDEKYTPLNTGSSLYGKLYPGKPVKLNFNGQTLFTGSLEKLVPHPRSTEQDAYMYVLDGFDFLSRARISTALYPEYMSGAVIVLIADAVGWPSQERVIDTGYTRYSYTIWFLEEALGALHDAENHEQGFVYIDHRGYLIFEDRNHRLRETRSKVSQATFDDDDIFDIGFDYGSARIYNRAEGERINWTVPGVEAEIARLSGENPMIPYKESRTFWVEFDEITDTVVTPVKSTDVDATTVAAGAGDDKNDDLSVTLTQYAKGAKVIFANNADVNVYLSVPGETGDGFKVRGEPFTKNAPIKIFEEDQTSIDDHGIRTYKVPGTSFETIENLRSLCVRAVHRYKDPQGMVTMTLKNYSAAFLTTMLGLRISDRITVTNAKLHLDAEDFYINKFEHIIENAGNTHTMMFTLARAFDEEFVILGVSALGVNSRLG